MRSSLKIIVAVIISFAGAAYLQGMSLPSAAALGSSSREHAARSITPGEVAAVRPLESSR